MSKRLRGELFLPQAQSSDRRTKRQKIRTRIFLFIEICSFVLLSEKGYIYIFFPNFSLIKELCLYLYRKSAQGGFHRTLILDTTNDR